jgi:hypothetical protein
MELVVEVTAAFGLPSSGILAAGRAEQHHLSACWPDNSLRVLTPATAPSLQMFMLAGQPVTEITQSG